MSATNLNIRTDKDVKEQAEQIFAELGLNVPIETTVATIEEGKRLLNDLLPLNIPVWKISRLSWNHEICHL